MKTIVEPKKNFLLVPRDSSCFFERSLRLYKNSPGLWKHTFRDHKKAAVEHVFDLVKLHNPPLRARTLKNKHKHVLAALLVYNPETMLRRAQNKEN